MKIRTIAHPDLGVSFFEMRLSAGASVPIKSPVTEFALDSPSVSLLVEGSLKVENPNRDPITLTASTERGEGGMAFPGTYKFTALEPSLYLCVSPINIEGPHMFELDHHYLDVGDTLTLDPADGFITILVVAGTVVQAGAVVAAGRRIDVPKEGLLEVTAMDPCHVVAYRRKAPA